MSEKLTRIAIVSNDSEFPMPVDMTFLSCVLINLHNQSASPKNANRNAKSPAQSFEWVRGPQLAKMPHASLG